MLKKKNWANFQRIIDLFTQIIVTKLSKIWVWDPRSGIRKKPILDPGSRGQKRHRIRIRNTAKFCITFGAIILNEAQVGSYVPAEQATFRIPDRILSRVSNRDSLQTNSSTVSLFHS
jgi:hypothetical protein